MSSTSKQRGFTIIELLIATAVFSTVLLLCTSALLQISRTYFKGTVSMRTQEVGRTIMADISERIQFTGSVVYTGLTGPGGSSGMCIGQHLYSFMLGRQLPTNDAGVHAFVVRDLNRPCTSTDSADDLLVAALPPGSREFLQPQMRLSGLVVNEIPPGSGLYKISIRIAYGDNDLLEDRIIAATGLSGTDGILDSCRGQAGSQFCAVAGLTGTTTRRVQ